MDGDHHDYEETSILVRRRSEMRLETQHKKYNNAGNNYDSSSSSNEDERIRRTVRSNLHEEPASLQMPTPLRSTSAAFRKRKRTLAGSGLPSSPAASAATDTSSGNVVTASTTTTSDDRDSSGGDGTANVTTSVAGSVEPESSGHDSGTNSCARAETAAGLNDNTKFPLSALHSYQHGPRHYHHRHHHFHHAQRHRDQICSRNIDDGSTLQVPGDDGSERLATGNGAGILQPATVVASRYTSSMSGGSGGEGEFDIESQHHLFPPHREPGYHTIRKTLNQFHASRKFYKAKTKQMKRARSQSSAGSTTDSSTSTQQTALDRMMEKRIENNHTRKNLGFPDIYEQEENGGGSSSGSGTEGGYAGSASSNETTRPEASCSSPSMSSSEESQTGRKRLKTQRRDDAYSSSEIADFSSGSSEATDDDGVRPDDFDLKSFPDSSSNDGAADDLEESYLSAKRAADEEHEHMIQAITRKRKTPKYEASRPMLNDAMEPLIARRRLTGRNAIGQPPILTVASDIMAHVLTFLQPPEILEVLTMPLSKGWQQNFTRQPELWRVLCMVEPFKANVNQNSSSSDDDCNSNDDTASSSGDSFCSVTNSNVLEKNRLETFRGLYTSFVRCMKYLCQIRDDALNGRPPAYIDYGYSGAAPVLSAAADRKGSSSPPPPDIASKNTNLQNFLASARGVVIKSSENSDNDSLDCDMNVPKLLSTARVATVSRKIKGLEKGKEKKPIFGPSMITGRLLGPTAGGEPGNMNLPWSCALYSIVNWMVAYTDVEGIQTLCLKVLPCILEDEQHRLTAQTARLLNVVLRAMVLFPNSEQLHIAAFHAIVLLARPHGGREGMLFHSSMTAAGIFGVNGQNGRSGIAVMLDSMLRFQDSPVLLAMSCWALVNIALDPEQKAALVKLGGIQAATNAMQRHPCSADVQFRALFALINLVIPTVRMENRNENVVANGEGGQGRAAIAARLVPIAAAPVAIEEEICEAYETTEREIIDGQVVDISSLVVGAMKNFCSSEAILNRACLVLHNLSLTEDYHSILLWTPQCYQMLEWCIANHRTDHVLQQSASGTLHRLKLTLSHNEELRKRFSKSLQKQQQMALEQARNEARRLNEQQEMLLANAREAAAKAETNEDPFRGVIQ